ncbi:uncharacterized protein LOC106084746 [Stomoxys calcitrans]|uniref:uncharacterized protein LOC106084746 n=1 Tax=Stomoxys calcitrans TaxID=35570 RepID=UPI0027E3AD88|nr:uncharacterized protein LOC106084746 [Stomoxys calcitrans]
MAKRAIFLSGTLMVVSLALHLITGLRDFVIDIDTLQYEFDPNLTKSISMELVRIDGHNKINGSFSFVNDLHAGGIRNWATLNQNNGRQPLLYNISIDGCQFLENLRGKFNPIFGVVMQLLKKYVRELPAKCPLRKDQIYTIMEFYYNEDIFPPYIPDANFTAFLGISHNQTYAFSVFLTAHVKSKNSAGIYLSKGKNQKRNKF